MATIRDQDLALVRYKLKHAAQLDFEHKYDATIATLLRQLNHVALTIYRIKDWTFNEYTAHQRLQITNLNAQADVILNALSNVKKRTLPHHEYPASKRPNLETE